jgi:hypothetical protein
VEVRVAQLLNDALKGGRFRRRRRDRIPAWVEAGRRTGRASARSGLARPMKIAKSKHPPIVREKGRRNMQRRIAQERVPTVVCFASAL